MSDTIPLWPTGLPADEKAFDDAPDEIPHLVPFVLPAAGTDKRACVIVCPGGGYHRRAPHEGDPVAEWLNSIGISAVVLHYRVKRRFPHSLRDAERAIRIVRSKADEWHLDTDKIGILGFSAGGHLAASACTLAADGDVNASDPLDRLSARPNAGILCYPVITAKQGRHQGSIEVLIGKEPWDPALRDQVALECQVDARTPPCFLWHTSSDTGVPISNSFGFANACAEHKIPVEVHVFPTGRHGLGLASDDPIVSQWTALCAVWLRNLGFTHES
jgi:acetyl esterase/lipase